METKLPMENKKQLKLTRKVSFPSNIIWSLDGTLSNSFWPQMKLPCLRATPWSPLRKNILHLEFQTGTF